MRAAPPERKNEIQALLAKYQQPGGGGPRQEKTRFEVFFFKIFKILGVLSSTMQNFARTSMEIYGNLGYIIPG